MKLVTDIQIPVAFYARVSSEEQAKGSSVAHQFSYLEDRMKAMGKQYYTNSSLWYADEGVSGYTTQLIDRDGMNRLFADGEADRFRMVLVKDSTRIARDREETQKLPRKMKALGIRTQVLFDGYDSDRPETETLLGIFGDYAQKFSENLSINVSISKRQKAKDGMYAASTPPVGYAVDKSTWKLVESDEAYIVRLIFDMYVNQRVGTTIIGYELRDRGIKTRYGNFFETSHIRNMLKNTAYIGHTTYGSIRNYLHREINKNLNTEKKVKQRIKSEPIFRENTHAPIIEEYIFWKAQEIMQKKNRHSGQKGKAKHPLVGVLFCSKCGKGMVCQKSKGYRYYRCGTQISYGIKSCVQDSLIASNVEKQIFDELVEEINKSSITSIGMLGEIESSSFKVNLKELESKKKKLLKRHTDAFINKDDLLTEESFTEIMLQIKSQIKSIDEQIQVASNQIEEIEKKDRESYYFADVMNKLQNIDLDDEKHTSDLRVIFHELIESIEVINRETLGGIKYRYNFA